MATAYSRLGPPSAIPSSAAYPPSPGLSRAASASSLRRRSSSSHPSLNKLTDAGTATHDLHHHPVGSSGILAAPPPAPPRSPPPIPSLLQPRVAVVLNVPKPWHPWLFALRLFSIIPALWWGLPSLLRLLLHFLPGPPDHQFLLVRPGSSGNCVGLARDGGSGGGLISSCAVDRDGGPLEVVVAPYDLVETALATTWCFACGYLSFFFTDCLMSRWLINYTPQATLVRLLSINAVNAYVTLSVLSLSGGFEDSRLLLPGWVGIATTLTVCYHITHQKINIRKETSTSVNVFSIASYITMVVLLAHMHSYQADYPTMPVVTKGRHLWQEGLNFVANIKTLIKERAES